MNILNIVIRLVTVGTFRTDQGKIHAKGGIVYTCFVARTRQKRAISLIAQRRVIAGFCEARNIQLVREFREVKSAEDHDKRPQVLRAVNWCRSNPEYQLFVAKQNRLARSVLFIALLIKWKVRFVSVESPNANNLQKYIQAAFDEYFLEENRINTRVALQAKKEMGFKLGGNVKKLKRTLRRKKLAYLRRIKRTIRGLQKRFRTVRQLAEALNRMRFRKLNGKRVAGTSVKCMAF